MSTLPSCRHPTSRLDCILGIFPAVLLHIAVRFHSFFLILLGLYLYLTSTYPVIFLCLFNVLSLSFLLIYSERVQDFVFTLTSCLWKIASTNTRCVYISVWVWIMCALLKQFFHLPPLPCFHSHDGMCLNTWAEYSFWLKLNQNWDLILSRCKEAFSLVPGKN